MQRDLGQTRLDQIQGQWVKRVQSVDGERGTAPPTITHLDKTDLLPTLIPGYPITDPYQHRPATHNTTRAEVPDPRSSRIPRCFFARRFGFAGSVILSHHGGLQISRSHPQAFAHAHTHTRRAGKMLCLISFPGLLFSAAVPVPTAIRLSQPTSGVEKQ